MRMAGKNRQSWSPNLKDPAVKIIDLLSGDEEETLPCEIGQTHNAFEEEEEEEEEEQEDDEDSDQCSIYEDLLNMEEDDDSSLYNGKLSEHLKRGPIPFGIRPPFFFDGQPDEAYYKLLELGICRELSRRDKLPQYNTVDDAVTLLNKSRNIMVLTGAGISTSLGIPDFRSKETGLYSQLQHLGLSDPQEVFDISLFREDPSIFYSVAKNILPSSKKFSPTHAFIRFLQDQGRLLTNFTQNIDNLEGHAGIIPEKLIQCHGSFATATCVECKYKVKGDVIFDDLKAGRVARCDRCLDALRDVKSGFKRKRSSDSSSKSRKKRQSYEDSTDEDVDIAVAGVMKPDITFFGEGLPDSFHQRLINHDRDLVDLVLVMGTSLKVAPVSEVVGVIPSNVPQLYISREPCSHVNFDIDLLGDCDTVVTELCRRAGWDLKHEMVKAGKIIVEPHEGYTSRFSIKATIA
ncbi:MAG: hypothetical protein Q9217_006002 [Psora testacea]